MKLFAEVARAESFTQGAKRLNTSTRVASAAVKTLESRLGAKLMNRTTRKVRLTDAGKAYLERCQQLLLDLDELESSVQATQSVLAGPIRITAPTAFGSLFLSPALGQFLTDNTQVSVELSLSDRRVSIVEEGFDIAIRLGTLQDSGLMYRRLADMPFITCASPAYLSQHGIPSHPSALSTHECLIATTLDTPHTWRFAEKGQGLNVSVKGRFRANAPLPAAQLAKSGFGITQVPAYMVNDALAEGSLVRILREYERTDFGVFALYPANRFLTARIQALLDYMTNLWHFD
ncbi:LysR family transcriptional regulator [Neptunicella marina]|nr:LysR family transcriptional regulator [Neptunicella marina]